ALSTGDVLLTLRTTDVATGAAGIPGAKAEAEDAGATEAAAVEEAATTALKSTPSTAPLSSTTAQLAKASDAAIYAGPAVRRLARELGANLAQVKGTGVKGRVTKDDLKAHVKQRLARSEEHTSELQSRF